MKIAKITSIPLYTFITALATSVVCCCLCYVARSFRNPSMLNECLLAATLPVIACRYTQKARSDGAAGQGYCFTLRTLVPMGGPP